MKVPKSGRGDGRGTPVRDGLAHLSEAERARLRSALLSWYRPRSRPFHFRATRDPWGVLVCEVMAQQTQVARVDPAWVRFMGRFPTPAALSGAAPAEVLRAWAGLGYNRRAVQLQRCARLIVERHDGEVPGDVEALQALPGIGPYTARAVAAVAFGRPLAAVDTNVRRVATRLAGAPMSERDVQATADGLLDSTDPAAWTHAMMDLGATVCRPRDPACGICPLAAWCASVHLTEMPSGALTRGSRGGRGGGAGSAQAIGAPPFERTTRWLRGRIVAMLRDTPGAAWTHVPDEIGSHDSADVAAAVDALERDGLLERRRDGAVRLPSGVP